MIEGISNQEKSICREGEHNFFVIPRLIDNPPENAYGLMKYDYTFLLFTSYDIINYYHIAFKGSFPVNVNIHLNQRVLYEFIPENFCLNFLIKNKVATFTGTLIEFYSKRQVLFMTWVNVEEIYLNAPIESPNDSLNDYYIMTNIYETIETMKQQEVLLMKKVTMEKGSFYQLAMVNAFSMQTYENGEGSFKKDGKKRYEMRRLENNENYVKIGTLAKITKKNGGIGIVEKSDYTAILLFGTTLKYYEFNQVRNIVCLTGKNMDVPCSFKN